MTIGILATRYAKALYGFALDAKEEDKVYLDMKYLYYQLLNVPHMQSYISNPSIKSNKKIEMLITATSVEGAICKCTERFFDFIFEKEKSEYLLYMVPAYLSVYRKEKKIIWAQLVSAEKLEDSIVEEIKELAMNGYGKDFIIELDIRIQPNLIGGFKLTVEDRQLDASVVGELKRIQKALIAQGN